MRLMRLFLVLAFAVQALGLGELLHGDEGHAASACEQSHSGPADSGEHGDCHWHCGTCVHPGAPLTAHQGPDFYGAGVMHASTPFGFIPAAPCASIFHPPA